MKTKLNEKTFRKWISIRAIIIIGIYLIVAFAMSLIMDKTLVGKSINLTNILQNYPDEAFTLEDLKMNLESDELVTFKGFRIDGDTGYWIFEPTMKGEGKVYFYIEDIRTGNSIDSGILMVQKSGLIIEKMTGNFTHYRERQICMGLLILALSILLWAGFKKSYNDIRFSYHSIYCAGLGLWMSILAVMILIRFFGNANMIDLYGTLRKAASIFSVLTFPLVFVFSILLTISNISLVKHEGYHLVNVLGIILSFVMTGGFFALFFFDGIISSGSETTIKLWETLTEFFETIYSLLECFLIGSIICGSKVAKNRPEYDKDYIVILGCMIAEDGSLYPLIKGRVDRAISFYKDQLSATGKKAIFIPSGGKGDDEPISEGEAMKNYLLSQGIDEDHIISETRSKNTRENMEFSMALMEKDKKAVFSTTNFHVFRSGIIAREEGYDIDGMGAKTKWYFWPNAYIREVIGMLSYEWKSLILFLIPIVAFLTVIRFTF